VATLEDGLYVLEESLEPTTAMVKDKLVRFVKASMKGWAYGPRKTRMRPR
jgi:NitT/TauT family transport system substrate-binding protein